MCMRMRMLTKFSLSLSVVASLAEALLLLLPSRSARRSARSRRACSAVRLVSICTFVPVKHKAIEYRLLLFSL